MKFCVLMASPRLNGDTAELVKPFLTKLKKNEVEATYMTLAEKNILPCRGCYACQNISDEYGCVQQDDTAEIRGEGYGCISKCNSKWYANDNCNTVINIVIAYTGSGHISNIFTYKGTKDIY